MMGPCFIKIIHYSNIQNQKLRIPEKFVRKYGADFSDLATLIVPGRAVWRVEMKKKNNSNGGVCFQNGLNEFIKFYSINPGHLLMFRYNGNSHFHVVIFDMSASEINYPYSNNNNFDDSDDDDDDDDDDDKEEEEEEEEPTIINIEDAGGPSETMSWEQDQTEEEDYYESKNSVNKHKKMKNKKKKNGYDHRRRMNAAKSMRMQQRANQITEAFKSKHPFFTVALQSSYVHHKYLPIPSTFKEKHLLEKLKYITLEVEDGGSWQLGFLSQYYEGVERVRFSKGVAAFLCDNNLVEGDICVFEMKMRKNSSEFVLKVHIYHRLPGEL